MIKFSKDGAFSASYIDMKIDIAFINGFLGKLQTDADFNNAYENAKKEGMKVQFEIVDDFQTVSMELARIKLITKDDEEYTILGDFTGSGTFRISKINGCSVDIVGDNYVLLIFCHKDFIIDKERAEHVLDRFNNINSYNIDIGDELCIIEIKSALPFNKEKLEILNRIRLIKKFSILDLLIQL